jgi:lipopolysaccharide biosynthesis regulator YciM
MHCLRALRFDPTHVRARVNVGNILKEDDQLDAAANGYDRVYRAAPEFRRCV